MTTLLRTLVSSGAARRSLTSIHNRLSATGHARLRPAPGPATLVNPAQRRCLHGSGADPALEKLKRCYRVLGLPMGATLSKVKTAYYEKEKLYHPDRPGNKNDDGAKALRQQCVDAYDFLRTLGDERIANIIEAGRFMAKQEQQRQREAEEALKASQMAKEAKEKAARQKTEEAAQTKQAAHETKPRKQYQSFNQIRAELAERERLLKAHQAKLDAQKKYAEAAPRVAKSEEAPRKAKRAKAARAEKAQPAQDRVDAEKAQPAQDRVEKAKGRFAAAAAAAPAEKTKAASAEKTKPDSAQSNGTDWYSRLIRASADIDAKPNDAGKSVGADKAPKAQTEIKESRMRAVVIPGLPSWAGLHELQWAMASVKPGAVYKCTMLGTSARFVFFDSAAAARLVSAVRSKQVVVRAAGKRHQVLAAALMAEDISLDITFRVRILSIVPKNAAGPSGQICQTHESLTKHLNKYGAVPEILSWNLGRKAGDPLELVYASCYEAQKVAQAIRQHCKDINVEGVVDMVGSLPPHLKDKIIWIGGMRPTPVWKWKQLFACFGISLILAVILSHYEDKALEQRAKKGSQHQQQAAQETGIIHPVDKMLMWLVMQLLPYSRG